MNALLKMLKWGSFSEISTNEPLLTNSGAFIGKLHDGCRSLLFRMASFTWRKTNSQTIYAVSSFSEFGTCESNFTKLSSYRFTYSPKERNMILEFV
jgi:hypothetical protein